MLIELPAALSHWLNASLSVERTVSSSYFLFSPWLNPIGIEATLPRRLLFPFPLLLYDGRVGGSILLFHTVRRQQREAIQATENYIDRGRVFVLLSFSDDAWRTLQQMKPPLQIHGSGMDANCMIASLRRDGNGPELDVIHRSSSMPLFFPSFLLSLDLSSRVLISPCFVSFFCFLLFFRPLYLSSSSLRLGLHFFFFLDS